MRRHTTLFIAMLAILGQLLIGAAVPAEALLAASSPPAGIPICHATDPDEADPGAPIGHPAHTQDCALCPVCQVLAASVAVPAPPTFLPPPAATTAIQPAPLPPARAPPGSPLLAATYPTGPPRLA